ncbi:MAG: DUF5034 domain-containing protein [Rikenellaceae bacterium]|jgi:hypothetical protein|nr:DUF5034 domain-containing protein [Rikenellaceae bacterium]
MKKLLFPLLGAALLSGCSKKDSGDIGGPDAVVPVHIVGIEATNVDNSGEYPLVTNSPINKKAYMIGVVWLTDNSDPNGDQYIGGPITADPWGRHGSTSLSSSYTKRIITNDDFNPSNPAGSNISQFFQPATVLPPDVDEGFVLLVAPTPGQHSFKVRYSTWEGVAFEYDTPPVTFF